MLHMTGSYAGALRESNNAACGTLVVTERGLQAQCCLSVPAA
jgi:hypothetical protein